MVKVTVIAFDGFDLWYNSSDHMPPHFHVSKAGHWEIRVRILSTTRDVLDWEYKWQKKQPGPSAKDLKAFRRAVCASRDKLLAEWQQKVVLTEETK